MNVQRQGLKQQGRRKGAPQSHPFLLVLQIKNQFTQEKNKAFRVLIQRKLKPTLARETQRWGSHKGPKSESCTTNPPCSQCQPVKPRPFATCTEPDKQITLTTNACSVLHSVPDQLDHLMRTHTRFLRVGTQFERNKSQ